MIKVTGKGNISATIIAHSKSAVDGKEIITYELEYHRFVHCFDDKTEVLARTSSTSVPVFMSFKEAMSQQCEVAQTTEDFEVTFVNPTAWICQDFDGQMVQFKNQRLSFSVTKGHRLFVGSRKNGYDKKEVILAESLLGNHTQKRFYKTGFLKDTKDFNKSEVKLLAYFISDGTLPRYGSQAIFRFKKERKIIEVCRLLGDLGVEYSKRTYGDGTTNIVLSRLEWMEKCYDNLLAQKRNKCIPVDFFYMNTASFEHFKQGLLESDGNVDNQDFNTYSDILIEQLQSMAHLHGTAFNLKKYGDCYKIKFQTEDTPILREDKHTVELVDYNGKVYCCTVPTGLIFVRRDGIVHISGNCELMTHRTFSRNAASSRAIPVSKMAYLVENTPAMPIYWGKNQAGMQASEECNNEVSMDWDNYNDMPVSGTPQEAWAEASRNAVYKAVCFNEAGYHKQITNRLLEPFQTIKVVVTATEFDNFFWLRFHKAAQPEIQELARCMLVAKKRSVAEVLQVGEWHTPYVDHWRDEDGLKYILEDEGGQGFFCNIQDALKVSASCCAQVSYRKTDDSLEKADKVWRMLTTDERVHSSPTEHQATPIDRKSVSNFTFFKDIKEDAQQGVTHFDVNGGLWSNNFCGWIQHRALIANNNCTSFDYDQEVDETGLVITDSKET